jgi:hypothetical protein
VKGERKLGFSQFLTGLEHVALKKVRAPMMRDGLVAPVAARAAHERCRHPCP